MFLCTVECIKNCLYIVFLYLWCLDCQTVLVELLVAMVSQRITAEELALLIRLFLEKTPPTVNTKKKKKIHQSLSSVLFAYAQLVFTVCKLTLLPETGCYV